MAVPDFHRMIAKNGAWLAQKVHRLILDVAQDLRSEQLLVLCPDEPGSLALADYLSVITGLTVNPVPKQSFINRLKDDCSNVHDLLKEHEAQGSLWLKQLRTASAGQATVILEEYAVSGGTARKLVRLLGVLNLRSVCHIAIVDFGSTGRSNRGVTSRSLYSLQIAPIELTGAANGDFSDIQTRELRDKLQSVA